MASAPSEKVRSATVCILGAGASGLPGIKECLEAGLEVTCFEKGDDIGGLWNYSEDESKLTVMHCTVTNVSKQRMVYSALPAPAEFGTFMPHSQWLEYLRLYVKKFDLMKHIRFNHLVESIRFDSSSLKWTVTVRGPDNATIPHLFDRVLYAAGPYAIPRWPTYPNLSRFEGEVLHGQAYKRPERFEGKRVIVAGLAMSGADCAVDLVGHAASIRVSRKHGMPILPRFTAFGKAIDHGLNRFTSALPPRIVEMVVNFQSKLIFGDYSKIGLGLDEPFSKSDVVIICDDFVRHVRTSQIQVRAKIADFLGGQTVLFEDGTQEEADVIIFCTGYNPNYNAVFDDPEIFRLEAFSQTNHYYDLYLRCLSTKYPGSLGFLGNIFVPASAPLMAEFQARYLAAVFSGAIPVPTKEVMEEELAQHTKQWQDRIVYDVDGRVRSKAEEFVSYSDKLASQVGFGVGEHLTWSLWWNNRTLYSAIKRGILSPSHYRIWGPGNLPNAADVVMRDNGYPVPSQ